MLSTGETVALVVPSMTAMDTLPATAVLVALAPAIASVTILWLVGWDMVTSASRRSVRASSAALVSAAPALPTAFFRFSMSFVAAWPDLMKFANWSTFAMPFSSVPETDSTISSTLVSTKIPTGLGFPGCRLAICNRRFVIMPGSVVR